MADVKTSSLCASLDLRTSRCRLTQKHCEFAERKNFRDCDESTFVTNVTIHGREFHILLNRDNRPTRGLVPVRTCRDTTWHAAAGAYANNIMSAGAERSLLEMEHGDADEIRLFCEPANVALMWRAGQFSAE